MSAQRRELLRLDLDAVDLRKGTTGLASILAFGVFVAVFGNSAWWPRWPRCS